MKVYGSTHLEPSKNPIIFNFNPINRSLAINALDKSYETMVI